AQPILETGNRTMTSTGRRNRGWGSPSQPRDIPLRGGWDK
ncbi:5679_t:CDS:1, partial [Scutellospora calospora]